MIDLQHNQLEKHLKYKNIYKTNTVFWGLGIENELYLEFENKKRITPKEFIENHKSERYSVDYYKNYKKEYKDIAFLYMLKYSGENILDCPILLNSHSLTKTDIYNNSKTLYTKKCENNPKFTGETFLDIIKTCNKLKSTLDEQWVFDGDSIEFMTINFFNTTLDITFNELNNTKKEFIINLQNLQQKLNLFPEYGTINLMTNNHPFAVYMTNFKNISMFNNGTLHFNVTLPTHLDENGLIVNKTKFLNDHSKAIKIIQWVEPLLISVYGSPDPFSLLDNFKDNNKFSRTSQRCAVSRYIGLGTYDSDKMIPGKILTMKIEEFEYSKNSNWWFNRFYDFCAYDKLENIGLDINFNKHYNHGIEIRFLDHITDDQLLYEAFEFIILLMDFILENDNINSFNNPIKDSTWNDIMLNCISTNRDLSIEQIKIYKDIFNINITETNTILIYYQILYELRKKYTKVYQLINNNNDNNKYILKLDGIFSSLTIEEKNISHDEYIKKYPQENINIIDYIPPYIPDKLKDENSKNKNFDEKKIFIKTKKKKYFKNFIKKYFCCKIK